MNSLLKASLDWINAAACPQEGFDHPNDENRVKCASKALFDMEIEINEKEVIDYCRQLGMPETSIKKLVNWYAKPQGLHLKNGIKFSTKDLEEIWKAYM